MSNQAVSPDGHHVYQGLHPKIYKFMVALAALYVVAAWIGFGESPNADYLLVVMSGFVAFSVALAAAAALAWRRNTENRRPHTEEIDEWAQEEFAANEGRIRGKTALIEILLPIASVAFGMTAFAILSLVMG